MCDYRKCPYRKEDCYQSDCWMTYNACTLVSEGRDYASCNPNAGYCKFSKSNDKEKEELIKQRDKKEKEDKIRRLQIEMETNNFKIKKLMEENEELIEQIKRINNN